MIRESNSIEASFLEGLQDDGLAAQGPNRATENGLNVTGTHAGPLPPALTHWLVVGAARAREPACIAFVEDVVYRAGLQWNGVSPATAVYRVLLPDQTLLTGLGYDTAIEQYRGATVRELLDRILNLEVGLLASAIWAADSFPSLRALLRDLGALVQYSSDLQGSVQGHVVPAATLATLIERVEASTYLSDASQLANEALPNLLGLRRKVMLLECERHERKRDSTKGGLRGLFGKFFR